MNVFKSPLLPFMTPTNSYKVWEWDEISKHNSIGVYVFWDKYVIDNYNENERFSYQFEDTPIYIGRADNLGKRVLNHLKGETHTEAYSCYFHTVDLYELKDSKTMDKEHQNYNAFKEIGKLQEIMKDNNGLNEEAITDFYELYFILLRLPFFNKRSSYFTANIYDAYTYNNRYINQHRKNWVKSEIVEIGGTTVEQFLQNKEIDIEQWYSLDDFINKVTSKWYIKNQTKIKHLKDTIITQVKNRGFPVEVTKGDFEDGTLEVAKEYVIFYDKLLTKDNYKRDYVEKFGKW